VLWHGASIANTPNSGGRICKKKIQGGGGNRPQRFVSSLAAISTQGTAVFLKNAKNGSFSVNRRANETSGGGLACNGARLAGRGPHTLRVSVDGGPVGAISRDELMFGREDWAVAFQN